jgi:hypothetical protein
MVYALSCLTSGCCLLFLEDYIHNAKWFSESQRILTEISKRLEGVIATCFVQRFTNKQKPRQRKISTVGLVQLGPMIFTITSFERGWTVRVIGS